MESSPKLSIVILNYMDYETTSHLVDMIIDYKDIDDIIIVDNHSDNDSFDVLYQKYANRCHVIQSESNDGYAAGNNIGIRYALDRIETDIICIANPDVEFESSTIKKIKSAFTASDYALVSPIMRDIDGNISKHPYWDLPTFWSDVGTCFTLYRKYHYKKVNQIDYTQQVMPVDVLPGSFLAFRKDALVDVGLFDDTLFLYCEERMISHKLLTKGYKIGLLTDAFYYHMHSKITKQFLKQIQIDRLTSEARFYYEVKYNRINHVQQFILKLAMGFSMVELNVGRRIKEGLRNLSLGDK